jgi:hypothetical protein
MFWEKVDRTGSCWEWTATKDPGGYGRFAVRRKLHGAHRIAYELTYGPIPDGLLVCHRCDNRSCVNPAHLFLGTDQDNTDDCIAKGRIAVGEQRGAKLTAVQVRLIRELAASGVAHRALGRQFGVASQTIDALIARRTWRHVV